jgi:hypothetical protein
MFFIPKSDKTSGRPMSIASCVCKILERALITDGKLVRNCEFVTQVLRHIAIWLTKRDGPKAPTAVYGPLEITYHPKEEANGITVYLENQYNLVICVTITMSDAMRLVSKYSSHL